MVGSFATLEVGDPHDTMQSLSEHFAPPAGETQQYWARTYEAADWRRYKIEPNAYRTLVFVGLIGGVGGQSGLTCLSSFMDQAAIKFSIKSPGLDFYYLSFLQEGSGELRQSGMRAQLEISWRAVRRLWLSPPRRQSFCGAANNIIKRGRTAFPPIRRGTAGGICFPALGRQRSASGCP
jgi:hypothetical protein